MHVDYAYICRGFYGSVADLKRLFQIKQVVLDTSLEDSYREKLKRECEIYGLNYIDMSEKYGAQNETYIEGWEKKTSNLLIYKRLCNV